MKPGASSERINHTLVITGFEAARCSQLMGSESPTPLGLNTMRYGSHPGMQGHWKPWRRWRCWETLMTGLLPATAMGTQPLADKGTA